MQFLLIPLCIVCLSTPAFAQVISSDSTTYSKVTKSGGSAFSITGGQQVGQNLFHSFREFSIPKNSKAVFESGSTIQNIFSRVTGKKYSQIDGALEAYGTANFYLLNPNGIHFGEHSTINIGGSFIGSSARGVFFDNGFLFSVDEENFTGAPLLKIAQPIGLQFGHSPGDIRVNAGDRTAPSGPIGGLKIKPGNIFALVGGRLSLEGGVIGVEASNLSSKSHLYFGGIINSGTVKIKHQGNQPRIILPSNNEWATVEITDSSLIRAEGGDIAIDANQILIRDNSFLDIGSNIPGFAPGQINITAQGNGLIKDASIVGGNGVGNPSVSIQSKSLNLDNATIAIVMRGPGKGGDISLTTEDFLVLNDSFIGSGLLFNDIFSSPTGSRTGDIKIATDKLYLTQASQLASGPIGPNLFLSLDSGDITINAKEQVKIDTGSIVSSAGVTTSEATGLMFGNVGNINIQTGSFELAEAGLSTLLLGFGNSGNITINSKNDILLKNGSGVDATNIGFGDTGHINLNAGGTILLEGTRTSPSLSRLPSINSVQQFSSSRVVTPSFISSVSFGFPLDEPAFSNLPEGGNSQGITLHGKTLILRDGAVIITDTDTQGDAGNIAVVTKESVSLGEDSFIASNVLGSGVGNGGEISIETKSLSLTQGAVISSVLTGSVNDEVGAIGNGGNIKINATENLTLSGIASETGRFVLPTAILAASDPGTIGSTGNIDINTKALRISDGAIVSIQKENDGESGVISIRSNTLQAANGGQIIANTRSDNQESVSNINLNVSDLIDLRGRDPNFDARQRQVNNRIIEANSGAASGIFARNLTESPADGGNVNIGKVKVLNVIDGATISALTEGSGNAGNLDIKAGLVLLRNQGEISAQANDQSSGGNIKINAEVLIGSENSDIIANAFEGIGGNISITADSIVGLRPRNNLTSQSDINASSQLGIDGTLEIDAILDPAENLANLPEQIPDISNSITQGCTRSPSASRLNLIGRGGVTPTPVHPLDSETIPISPLALPDTQVSINSSQQELALNSSLGLSNRPQDIVIVEAQKPIVTADGKIALVADQHHATTPNPQDRSEACRGQATS